MTTYDYITVPVSLTADDTLTNIKQYGSTGWKLVVIYNGLMFFERRTKTKVG